jgi:hypothetical protein
MHCPVGPQPVAGQSLAYDERRSQQAHNARRLQTTVDEESILVEGGVDGLYGTGTCCGSAGCRRYLKTDNGTQEFYLFITLPVLFMPD